jgi:uncharacterized protein
MRTRTDTLDLAPLKLRSGEGRRLELEVAAQPLQLGAERYDVVPVQLPVVVDVSRMVGGGLSLRLRFAAEVHGACMRCLEPAAPVFEVEAREVDQAGGGDDLDSPYVDGELVDVGAWANDALVLAVPQQLLCRPDCRGLCPVCGIDLNAADPGHGHEAEPDPRWAVLRKLKFD